MGRCRPTLLLVLAALALSAAACGGDEPIGDDTGVTSPGDLSDQDVATLSLLDLAAEVSLVDDDAFVPADDGAELYVGDAVRTDDSGFAQVDYVDGSLTRVDVDTTITVLSLGAAGVPDVDVDLDVGRVWNNVRDLGADGSFRVTTDVGVAAVRGTVFLVECRVDGGCRIEVFEGEVEFTSTAGVSVVIGAGESLEVAPDSDDLTTTPLPDTSATDPFRVRNEDLDGGSSAPSSGQTSASPLAGEYAVTRTLQPPGIQLDTQLTAADYDGVEPFDAILADSSYANMPVVEGESRDDVWTIGEDGTFETGAQPPAGTFTLLRATQYEAGYQALDTGFESCVGTSVQTNYTLLTVDEVVDGKVIRFSGLQVFETWDPDSPTCKNIRHRSSYAFSGERIGD